jgi:class 3 adenylate cyclase
VETPRVRYADAGDGKVGYQVFGEGAVDMVIAGGLFGSVDACWSIPGLVRIRRFFGSSARVIQLDYRGTGVSDPAPPGPWQVEQWAADIVAVLDDAGSTSAAFWGEHVGAHAAVRLAVDHPGRVRSLCLMNTAARFVRGDGYDLGMEIADADAFGEFIRQQWGSGAVYSMLVGPYGLDRETHARYERTVGPPSTIARLSDATMRSDVRDVLPLLHCPVLVVHTGDVAVGVDQAEDLAERVPGARLSVVKSTSLYWGEEHAELGMRWLLGEDARWGESDLATVLFTDVVESTVKAASLGDTAWRRELDALDHFVATEVARRSGRVVKHMGDGHLIEVRHPSEAVRLALTLTTGARALGTPIRAGLHTGEVLRRGDDLSGIAVHACARIAALADADEVLVSRTVRDLTAGSGLQFDPHGVHILKGLGESWELFTARRGPG